MVSLELIYNKFGISFLFMMCSEIKLIFSVPINWYEWANKTAGMKVAIQ